MVFGIPSIRPSVHPPSSSSMVPCVFNSSYSFMQIPLKLYRCLGQGLTMCILFGYNPQIILSLVSTKRTLSFFSTKFELIFVILCMQLLLQFYADSFETLQVFRSWSKEVHIFCIISDYFLLLYYKLNFRHLLQSK